MPSARDCTCRSTLCTREPSLIVLRSVSAVHGDRNGIDAPFRESPSPDPERLGADPARSGSSLLSQRTTTSVTRPRGFLAGFVGDRGVVLEETERMRGMIIIILFFQSGTQTIIRRMPPPAISPRPPPPSPPAAPAAPPASTPPPRSPRSPWSTRIRSAHTPRASARTPPLPRPD